MSDIAHNQSCLSAVCHTVQNYKLVTQNVLHRIKPRRDQVKPIVDVHEHSLTMIQSCKHYSLLWVISQLISKYFIAKSKCKVNNFEIDKVVNCWANNCRISFYLQIIPRERKYYETETNLAFNICDLTETAEGYCRLQ